MDFITGLLQGASWIGVILLIILIATFAGLFFKSRYKVAEGDEALVITGGSKGMTICKPGAGAFVSPLRRASRFPLGVMTVRSNDQETHSNTLVPIIVKWTAQLRADVDTDGALEKAVIGFSSARNVSDIATSLEQTLDGEVRAVVATMLPEEVIRNKEEFNTKVTQGVKARMEELGFSLVSLNITEVSDRNSHLHNLAATEREAKRQEAETTKANTDKNVAVAQAKADEEAATAELSKQLAIAERQREVDLRRAGIQSETSQAQVDAKYAEEQRRLEREKQLANSQGQIAVEQQTQAEAAALARRKVDVANAETTKAQQVIAAEADKEMERIAAEASAQQAEINATAAATVAQKRAEGEAGAAKARALGEADAAEATATGAAKAAKAKAQGEAEAMNLHTEAEARRLRETGEAEAQAIRARGLAEAAAQLEQGKATAEAERLLAEARAANEGVNLKIALAEIESKTRVSIATALGTAMHEVGTNATIIDMGGGSSAQGGLLGSFLGGIPELVKLLDVKSQALNGGSFGETVGNLFTQVAGNNTPQVLESTEEASKQ